MDSCVEFYIFKWLKTSTEPYFGCENYMKFKQFLLSINKVLLKHSHLLHIIYGYFHSTVAELTSDRLYSIQSLKYLLFGSLQRSVDP